MSQENVEVIRAAIEAMNRRDIDGVLRLMDPGVRFEHRLAALEGNFVGVEGVRAGSRTSLRTSTPGRSTARTSVIWATGCLRWAPSRPPGGQVESRPSCPSRSWLDSRTNG
jgi:hypothetical protein